MEKKNYLEWFELGTAIQEQYRDHARYLIENGYIFETIIDNLAKRIYDKDMQNKIKEINYKNSNNC